MATEELTGWQVAERLAAALEARDAAAIDELAKHYPHEVAQAVYRLSPDETQALITLIGRERMAEIIEHLDPAESAEVLLRLDRREAADILEEMDPDDATDVVEELPPAEAEDILVEMEPTEAEEVRELLTYPPDTAGGLMTPEFVAVSPGLTVEEAIAGIRQVAAEAETVYYVYVTDEENHLLGVLSLRGLLLARPGQTVGELMNRDVVRVYADLDQEETARIFSEHNFLALPVVDRQNRLLGIITGDDVVDVIQEETTEDIERLGGSQPLQEPYLHASVVDIVRKRVGWLMLLFVAATYTGTVLGHFQNEISRVVGLAIFIPLLIGTGGNVASQTIMTIVRAMAVGEVDFGDVLRVIAKEMAVGVVLGLIIGLATYFRVWVQLFDPRISLAVAFSAVFIVLWAATVAAVLPLLLRRVGVDPAVVSAPFITTLVDGTGLFIYFEIARYVLEL